MQNLEKLQSKDKKWNVIVPRSFSNLDMEILERDGKLLIDLPFGLWDNGYSIFSGRYRQLESDTITPSISNPENIKYYDPIPFEEKNTKMYIDKIYISPGRGVFCSLKNPNKTRTLTQVSTSNLLNSFNYTNLDFSLPTDEINLNKTTLRPGENKWVNYTCLFFKEIQELNNPDILFSNIKKSIYKINNYKFESISDTFMNYIDPTADTVLSSLKIEDLSDFIGEDEVIDLKNKTTARSYMVEDIIKNPKLRKAGREKSIQRWIRKGFDIPITKTLCQQLTYISVVKNYNAKYIPYDPSDTYEDSIIKESYNKYSYFDIALNWDILNWAVAFKDISPEQAEKIFILINGKINKYIPSYAGINKTNAEYIRIILKKIGPNKFINALKIQKCNDLDNNALALTDIFESARMLEKYNICKIQEFDRVKNIYPKGLVIDFKWKTFSELHNKLSVRSSRIEKLKSKKKIEWSKEIRNMHGIRYKNARILLPRTKISIIRWGESQKHCVASYADQMLNKKIILAAVYIDNKLLYTLRFTKSFDHPVSLSDHGIEMPTNVETYKWSLTEFRGFQNKWPDPKDAAKVSAMIQALDLKENWINNQGWRSKNNTKENWFKEYQNELSKTYTDGYPTILEKPINNWTKEEENVNSK